MLLFQLFRDRTFVFGINIYVCVFIGLNTSKNNLDVQDLAQHTALNNHCSHFYLMDVGKPTIRLLGVA